MSKTSALPTLEAPRQHRRPTGRPHAADAAPVAGGVKPLGEVVTLKLSDRGSWSLQLDDEAQVVLGRGSDADILAARAERFRRHPA